MALLLFGPAGLKEKPCSAIFVPATRLQLRGTSSDAVGSRAAGTAQTRQHFLLEVDACSCARAVVSVFAGEPTIGAELAVWLCRARRSVRQEQPASRARPGDRVTPEAATEPASLLRIRNGRLVGAARVVALTTKRQLAGLACVPLVLRPCVGLPLLSFS